MSFRFKQFAPKIPSTLVLHVYEEVFYRAVIEVDETLSPHKVIVEVLTTQRDSKEPSGALHHLKLYLRGPLQEKNMYVYGASAILISMCTFEFSYRAKIYGSSQWITPPTQPEIHGIARVLAIDPMKMAPILKNQPNFSHIVGPLYIGDAVTMEQVPSLEFTHVLCVDSDLQQPWWVEKLKPTSSPSYFNIIRKQTYAGISYLHSVKPVKEIPIKEESISLIISAQKLSYLEENITKVDEDLKGSQTNQSITAGEKPDETANDIPDEAPDDVTPVVEPPNVNENNAELSNVDDLTLDIPNVESPDIENVEIAIPEFAGPEVTNEFVVPESVTIDIVNPGTEDIDIVIPEPDKTENEKVDTTKSETFKSTAKSEADKNGDLPALKPENEQAEIEGLSTKSRSEDEDIKDEGQEAEELPEEESVKLNPVLYHWIPYPSTPEKQLSEDLLRETVEWLNKCWYENNCILISSTNGFLKAGMAALAFVYANNLNKTFKQCYNMINCKRPIFYYHDSERSLHRLFRKHHAREMQL